MDWFNSFTLTVGLTGIIFWALSTYMKRNPPHKINHLYGYRTKASMSSQERWDFAQEYSSDLLTHSGKMLMIGALVWMFLPNFPELVDVILAVIIVIAACIHSIIQTEKALKSKFG